MTGTPLLSALPWLGASAGAEAAGVLAGAFSLPEGDAEAVEREGEGEDDAGAVPSAVAPAAPTGRFRAPSPSPSGLLRTLDDAERLRPVLAARVRRRT
ncbi:hypothetical protein [Streptomyces sp. S-9]|uniref:hypothetical protein n=1 Tax=Streptomyces sp. S-9 TaxID=2806600 RepID=UPI0035ABFEC7